MTKGLMLSIDAGDMAEEEDVIRLLPSSQTDECPMENTETLADGDSLSNETGMFHDELNGSLASGGGVVIDNV